MTFGFVLRALALFVLCLHLHLGFCQLGKLDDKFSPAQGMGHYVRDIVVLPDSGILVAGSFSYSSERPMNGVTKLYKDGSNNYTFNIGSGANGIINAIAYQPNGQILLGGDFTTFNGTTFNRIIRLNGDGSMDTTFHPGTGFNGSVNDIIVQADSMIVVVGNYTSFNGASVSCVSRLKFDGTLDAGFVTGTNPPTNAIKQQSDGKYLIAGTYNSTYKAMRRLNSNGSIDTTFNNGNSGANSDIYDILILSSGKICIVGNFTTYNGAAAPRILELNANGTAYTTFSPGTGFNGIAKSIVEQSDGKLIVVGSFTSYGGTSINRIVRINSTGTRDTGFNPGSGFADNCNVAVLSPEGVALVAGLFKNFNGYARQCFAKLNYNGSLDLSFLKQSGISDRIWAIGVQSDGKYIIGGDMLYADDMSVNRIFRLDSKGKLDTSFQTGTGANGRIMAIKILSNNKILVGGLFTAYNGTSVTRIMRLNANGTIDNTFTATSNGEVRDIEVDAQGRVYISGTMTLVNGVSRQYLARISSSGATDNTFNVGSFSGGATVHSIALQADGKLLIGGSFTTYKGLTANRVVRVDTVGTVDTSFSSYGGANGIVRSINVDTDSKIVIGGTFSTYNAFSSPSVVKLKTSGKVDSSFHMISITTFADANITAVPYRKGVFLGGSLSNVNGIAGTNALAYIDSAGNIDTAFYTGNGLSAPYSVVIAPFVDNINGRTVAAGWFPVAQSHVSSNLAVFRGAFDQESYAIDSVVIDTLVCSGPNVRILFHKLRPFSSGNIFYVQCSNATGTFSSPIYIGSKFGEAIGWDTIFVNIPQTLSAGSGYRVRIQATNAFYTSGPSNSFRIDTLTPPVPPASQVLCSDTAYEFIFDSIQCAWDSIEWATNPQFANPITVHRINGIRYTAYVGQIDTLYLRSKSSSGCVSRPVWTVSNVLPRPLPPTPPLPQALCADTSTTFLFSSISAYPPANQIQWSVDSTFPGYTIDSLLCNIEITLTPNSKVKVWMRAVDTASGCISRSSVTAAILRLGLPSSPTIDTLASVCTGNSTTISTNTKTGSRYYLKSNGVTIDSVNGTGSAINLMTNSIDSPTIYQLFSKSLSTSVVTLIKDNILIFPVSAVSGINFIDPDTLVYSGDTLNFIAFSENATRIRYKVVSGSATVDSITGKLSSVSSNFTLRASAYGLPGCDTISTDVVVKLTNVPEPTIVKDIYTTTVDSTEDGTVTVDSLYTSRSVDKIEWSYDESFSKAYKVSSGNTFTLTLKSGADTTFWVRSVDTTSGKVSRAKMLKAKVSVNVWDVAILDKSRWDLIWNDEFLYSGLPSQNNGFSDPRDNFANRWALNYPWGDAPNCNTGDCPGNCVNHTNWGQNNLHYHNIGNLDGNSVDGSAGEVIFGNGIASLRGELLPNPIGPFHCASGNDSWTRMFFYKSGMLASKNKVDYTQPGLVELRCKMPNVLKAWPAFWTFNGETELDFFDNQMDAHGRQTLGIVNWKSHPADGCGMRAYNFTSCLYNEDYFTYSCMWSNKLITFFINGRSVWSIKADVGSGSLWQPLVMNSQTQILINLAIQTGFYPNVSCSYDLDYFRYYRPNSGNITIPPSVFQNENIPASTALTLETTYATNTYPNLYRNSWYTKFNNTYGYHSAKASGYKNFNIVPSAGKIKLFYKGLNNKLCYAATPLNNTPYLDGVWRQDVITPVSYFLTNNTNFPVYSSDIKSHLTAANDQLIYYQSTGDLLRFLKKSGNTWVANTALTNTNSPINNCAGYITIDNLGRVFYKGKDKNLYCWDPGSRILSQITADGSLAGDVVVAKCGCLVFYKDNSNRLVQLAWWDVWRQFIVVDEVTVTDNLALDEDNGKVYFIGSDKAVYFYQIDYNVRVPQNLVRLGNRATIDNKHNNTECSDYYDSKTNLVLNTRKDMVFYRGEGGVISYYFNDKERSVKPYGNPGTVSLENWNKSKLDIQLLLGSAYAFAGNPDDALFFINKEGYLEGRKWTDGLLATPCPYNYGAGYPEEGIYWNKTDGTDTTKINLQDNETSFLLSVYPNPSDNTFTFKLDGLKSEGALQIEVFDVSGRNMLSNTYLYTNGTNLYTLNTADLVAGMYIYNMQINGKKYSGKLFKL